MDSVTIKVHDTNYGWIAICDDMPEIIGMGDDAEEALDDFIAAAQDEFDFTNIEEMTEH